MLGRSTVPRGPEGPAHAKRAPTACAALAGPACRPDSPHGRPVLLRVWGTVRRGFQQSFCPPPVPRGGSKQCPCSKARVQATHTSIFRAWICLDTQAYFASRHTLLLHISIFEFVTKIKFRKEKMRLYAATIWPLRHPAWPPFITRAPASLVLACSPAAATICVAACHYEVWPASPASSTASALSRRAGNVRRRGQGQLALAKLPDCLLTPSN